MAAWPCPVRARLPGRTRSHLAFRPAILYLATSKEPCHVHENRRSPAQRRACHRSRTYPRHHRHHGQVDGRAGPEFAKLFAVFQRVKASYVEPVEDDVLIRGAIDGMLAALDPHSAYLDGSDLQRLETMIDGQYSGLGLSVVMEDGAVKVVSPFRGSPAETAGVKAGDFITHLNGKLIVDTKLDDAVAQMRGPKGTSIQLTIFRRVAQNRLKST